MSESFLSARNLKYIWRSDDIFSREKDKLLWDIPSLEINQTGIVLLAGRNGAGKSTLLRCLLGLMRPTAGEIRWFNQSTPARGQIGYIPELPVLPARIKVAELVGGLLGMKSEELYRLENESDKPASLRIAELFDRPAHLLSKGQQQRLLLTLALAGLPKGFVLDEPFSGLDPWARTELADLLVHLAEKNHFILISSHDAPLKLKSHVRETWIIENKSLRNFAGCALPE